VEWDSLGAQVVGAGSHDGWLISWDNSSVGVGNQGAASKVGTQVVSACSYDCGLVSRDHSSVGVGNQVWDTSQGTSWGKGRQSGGNRADGTNSWANGGDGMNSWGDWGWSEGGASHNWTGKAGTRSDSGVESCSLGGQVISPGGNNRRGVSWGHSAIGVGDQMWDTSQGADVLTGSSDDWSHWGKDGASLGNNWGNWGGNGGGVESWANQAGSRCDSSMESDVLGTQVVGPSSHNGWLVSRGHGSIGVGHQWAASKVVGTQVVGTGSHDCWFISWDHSSVGVSNQGPLGAGHGDRGEKTQQLHIWFFERGCV